MTTSRTRRPVAGTLRASVLGVELSERVRFPDVGIIAPGTAAPEWLRFPTADAARLLRAVARLVADLPRDSSPDVVWTLADSQLLVHTGDVSLALEPELVTVTVPVSCDQVREATVDVPLAVGTTKLVRGLFASAFSTALGPPQVTDLWSDALTAFAWECLMTLAQHAAAEAGKDRRGRPLVPAAIAAERGVLLVKPMARNGD